MYQCVYCGYIISVRENDDMIYVEIRKHIYYVHIREKSVCIPMPAGSGTHSAGGAEHCNAPGRLKHGREIPEELEIDILCTHNHIYVYTRTNIYIYIDVHIYIYIHMGNIWEMFHCQV